MRFQQRGQYLCSFVAPESLFIDIMMNVPLIAYAANETDDDLRRTALAHCRTTRDTIVRPDGSTAHEGIFDTRAGRLLRQSTHQGLRADSTWARGMAWSMYGFSKVYRLTMMDKFLEVAERNTAFRLAHLPADRAPYWDFDAELHEPLKKTAPPAPSRPAGSWICASQTKLPQDAALPMLDQLTEPEYLAIATPG